MEIGGGSGIFAKTWNGMNNKDAKARRAGHGK